MTHPFKLCLLATSVALLGACASKIPLADATGTRGGAAGTAGLMGTAGANAANGASNTGWSSVGGGVYDSGNNTSAGTINGSGALGSTNVVYTPQVRDTSPGQGSGNNGMGGASSSAVNMGGSGGSSSTAGTSGVSGSSGSNSARNGSVASVNAGNTDNSANAAAMAGLLAKRNVYFDYDSFTVRPEYKAVLEAHAKNLAAKRSSKIALEGNTDERGGREYNLALGQKRANAVQQVLRLLGVTDSQMEAVSFGNEKPKATGTSESDYAENRRVDIQYK
jgi:peptidoglycan-associated lipoprotein